MIDGASWLRPTLYRFPVRRKDSMKRVAALLLATQRAGDGAVYACENFFIPAEARTEMCHCD